ncbi:hypothetical protein AAFN60_19255 [Roseibacillus persicicus]|uniref:hypothetical protein n=1 Tax=Roseibacillus persicicus TaxID=454148 RepID=UPI00398A6449
MKIEATEDETRSLHDKAVKLWVQELMAEGGPLLTRPQACGYLNVGEQFIIKSEMPYIKMGNSVRYRLSDLKSFEEKNLVK